MEELFDQFVSKKLSATNIESAVEKSVQAMDGLSQPDIEKIRALTCQLVVADFEDDSPGRAKGPTVMAALRELQAELRRLGDI